MKLIKIIPLCAIVFMSINSNAQLGKLVKQKGKITNKKSDESTSKSEESTTKSAEEPATKTTEESTTKSTKEPVAEVSKGLVLDSTTFRLTPAITMSSLLYGTNVSIHGGTSLTSYTGSFIPYKKLDGSDVSSIYDQSEYLKIKIYKGDKFIRYYEYSGSTTFENNKLRKFNEPDSRYKINDEWISGSNIDLKKWGEGMYHLDFYAGTKMFYTFEFEVYKVTNDDPYAEMNEMYLSRGPWDKYAYIENADKTGNFIFGFYLKHDEFQPNPTDVNKTTKPVNWSLKILKDGALYATHYNVTKPKTSLVERGDWKDFSTAMKGADGKTVLKVADLTDGSYKVELTLDSEPKPRIYKFTVKNNKIVYMAAQDRTVNTDPTRLVEGWNNFYWLELEK